MSNDSTRNDQQEETDGSDPSVERDEDASGRVQQTRRRLLVGTALATGFAGVGGFVTSEQEEPLDPGTTIVLGGEVPGWTGRQPEQIKGATNPTLILKAGETYTLRWENVDGAPHNVAFLDGEGNALRSTEIIDQQGATQSLSFTATEKMTTYVCEVHPNSMRGSVQAGPGGQTATPTPQQNVVPPGPTIGLKKVAGEPLTQPVGYSVADEQQNRAFVVDQTGQIYTITNGSLDSEPFLDLSDRIVIETEAKGGFSRPEGFDERGLLGLAFHPNFQQNQKFYVRYSGRPREKTLPQNFDHMAILAEFTATDDGSKGDPNSERVILEVPEPQFNHNAGDLAFGPDGYLYVPLGDGGGADDTGIGHVDDWYGPNGGGNGQDIRRNLLGTILRIDVDQQQGDTAYGVPEDNPFVGTKGRDEIYAYGFRNPWRISFNRGKLIAADVGQNLFEEVDLVEKGGNYGWNVREGFHCFSTENPSDPTAITDCPTNAPDRALHNGVPLRDPLLEYPHLLKNQTIGISVTGGYVYFQDTVGDLTNKYVFGDWGTDFTRPSGRLWVADLPGVDFGQGTETATPAPADTPTGTPSPGGGETTPTQSPSPGGGETPTGSPTGTPDGDQLPMKELQVEGTDGTLDRSVLSFGRDAQGELYVLTSTKTTIDGTGEVFKIVPPQEGDEITPAPTPSPTGTPTGTGEGG